MPAIPALTTDPKRDRPASVGDDTDRRDSEQQRWRWEQTFERTSRGICVLDADIDLIESVNPAFARMHGGATGDFVGQPISVLITPERAAQLPQILSSIDDENFVRVESEHVRLDGSTFPVMAEVLLTHDPQGRLLSRIVWLEDLTEQRAAEAARQEATEAYETAFSQAPMGVALIGFDGRFLRVNAALCEMFGRTEDELIGSTTRAFTHADDLELTADAFEHLTTAGTPLSVQKRYLRPDGGVVWAQTRGTAVRGIHGGPGHIVSHFLDITERKRLEAELQHLADHDPLTELWNRRRFNEELGRQVARCQRNAEHAALLLIDLNGFKQVNDTHGHQAGDDLLVAIAAALQRRLRATDSLFRLGGDEFAVILTNVSPAQADRVAAAIDETISLAGASINGTDLRVAGSIGIAVLDATVLSPQDVYVQADGAMYRTKTRTPGRSERTLG